jgi:hypothetical protein
VASAAKIAHVMIVPLLSALPGLPAYDFIDPGVAPVGTDEIAVGLIYQCCDAVPPTLEVSVTPDTLWPPNHKYVTVNAEFDVSDDIDPNPTVTIVSVTSNEPDDGLGDGDTPNDIIIDPDGTIDLRAERSGTGEGRIYTITYQATDACGNSTVATATMTVPLSKG